MPLIDFDTDILALWAGAPTVVGEEPYASGVINYPDRYDDDSEKRLLVLMDVLRAYMETLTSRNEMQRFGQVIGRLIGEVAYSRAYDSLGIAAVGNVPVGDTTGLEIGLVATAPDGTDAVTADAAVGGADLATLVANINALGAPFSDADGAGVYVEAYESAGKLGLRTTHALAGANLVAAQAQTITFTGDLLAAVGLKPGPYVNAVRAAARRARDLALAYYQGEIRSDSLP